jgi:hypothetical protein
MTTLPSETPPIKLSDWQKKQAAMLYHYSSLDYLKYLHRMVTNLINGIIDPLLVLAKDQNRDSAFINSPWGTRDTSDNWSSNAWPFLKEYQASLAKDIANRAFEKYEKTGTNDCFRGVAEYSLRWATIEEENAFDDIVRAISSYANKIDKTLDDYQDSRWTDFGFVISYKEYHIDHPNIPRFRIRADVVGESGKTPPRTGVYVSQDDPNASLQFAWAGNGGGKLRASKTFSTIGLAALHMVGRENLWCNDEKMFEFAMLGQHADMFRDTIYMQGEEHRDFSSMAVASAAFINRPCKWYFVEMVNDEFDEISEAAVPIPTDHRQRLAGGEQCVKAGYYFTPARPNSRQRFAVNQVAPAYGSQYGKTIWQWDVDQN